MFHAVEYYELFHLVILYIMSTDIIENNIIYVIENNVSCRRIYELFHRVILYIITAL